MQKLRSRIVRFTWEWAIIFVPIETYLSFTGRDISVSGYVVNVVGVGIMVWGAFSMRRGRPYAEGLLATGWGWTTAVFWRATNLRYGDAAHGVPLSFGSLELWLAPVFTMLAATALAGSLLLLVKRDERSLP